MGYLPEKTVAVLAADNMHELTAYLVAWAMLLTSGCSLVNASDEAVPLAHQVRTQKAANLLAFVRSCDQCFSFTRMYAERLLTELKEEELVEDVTPAQEDRRDHAIKELAWEMLTIRLA